MFGFNALPYQQKRDLTHVSAKEAVRRVIYLYPREKVDTWRPTSAQVISDGENRIVMVTQSKPTTEFVMKIAELGTTLYDDHMGEDIEDINDVYDSMIREYRDLILEVQQRPVRLNIIGQNGRALRVSSSPTVVIFTINVQTSRIMIALCRFHAYLLTRMRTGKPLV